ncbi:hypothetical protein [Streptomyces sparsogenes]|uniref:Uncharacterized protein n=1 Tax=Streptomyces sparsogenes DSM 40356 TaxID=1331668 RepID=A0A1R1S7Y9_9ACTN|nr:hypothetical protein [Streptomyces sparsogenes]OMI34400.1 hypothetical protein SPAR_36491 [Streptomyces sparsogenes DSM 40356]
MPRYTVKAEITRPLGLPNKTVAIQVDVDTTDPLDDRIMQAASKKATAKYGCARLVSMTGPSVRC